MTFNLVNKNQYGFKKGFSIYFQHIDIQKIIFDALNANAIAIDMIFLDFEKAFDKIIIPLLINKLKQYNIDLQYLKLIQEMLFKRLCYVIHNGVKSDIYEVDSGVSQGGVSSPHYFNLFINDLTTLIISHCLQYADDSLLLKVIINDLDCLILQNDLNAIFDYTVKNGIALNANKSRHVRITLKTTQTTLNYNINNVLIETVSVHKHLGVT